MTTPPHIAIIGAGNMGRSLIGGLINNGHPASKLSISDPSKEKLASLAKEFQINTHEDNDTALTSADVVIFAVKPQVLFSVIKSLHTVFKQHHPLIISIAAGVRIDSIAHCLAEKTAIIRVMPNTPALIGNGASALFANTQVSREERRIAENIMQAVGITVWLPDEALMDTVTALSGSGPAYFFLMMEIMQQTAEELGLNQETARLLTQQTALGAACMAMKSRDSLTELRQKVTSPGGTTEKALSVLEDNHIHAIFKQALLAAKQRSEELAEQFRG